MSENTQNQNAGYNMQYATEVSKEPGFVVYEPYKTVIPAYNLNAIQDQIIINRKRADDLLIKVNTLDGDKVSSTTLATEVKKLASDISNLDERVKVLEKHSKTYTGITFAKDKWSASGTLPRTQTVTATGITSADTPIIWLHLEGQSVENSQKIIEDWPLIGRIVASGENKLTAYCYENDVPSVNIPIMAKVVKDI